MGRLDCKEPSLIALEVLSETADNFVCIDDADADKAVEYLKKAGIETTPSGAAGLAAVLTSNKLDLDLGTNPKALTIVTEGILGSE